MSPFKTRIESYITTGHPSRFRWHLGKTFGYELCVFVQSKQLFRLFRFRLWRVELGFAAGFTHTVMTQDGKMFRIYPEGDMAKKGRPE